MAKKAFLVGINEYPVQPLRGCVNDVREMRKLLQERGYAVETVFDAAATKARVLDGLDALIRAARPGDHAVFHFSGHGAQVIDAHGDEDDGYDEALCPSDVLTGGYITDDEMLGLLAGVRRGALFELVLDCCHSGTGDRGEINLGIDGVQPRSALARFLSGPQFATHAPVRTKLAADAARRPDNNVVLWSACRDYETAADVDIGAAPGGAFTSALVRALRAAPLEPRERLIVKVARALRQYGFTQVPQVRCGALDSALPFLMDREEAARNGLDVKFPIKRMVGVAVRHWLDVHGF